MGKAKQPVLFDGALLINKVRGCTSHDVVDEARRILGQRAVGHAGTLDPLAEGLLPLLLGSATKLSQWLIGGDKRYRLTMRFGLRTDTLDADGKILKEEKTSLKKQDIEAALAAGASDLELAVPYFSAVKVKGRKLYSYARAGREVDLPVRKMSFSDLKIHKTGEDMAEVSISCRKGSYIRSWTHFLGEKLQAGACLMNLKRLSVGGLSSSVALTVSDLRAKLEGRAPAGSEELKGILKESFLFSAEALPQFPQLDLTGRDAEALRGGQIPGYIVKKIQDDQIKTNKTGRTLVIKAVRGSRLSALLELRPFKKIRILKNFPESARRS